MRLVIASCVLAALCAPARASHRGHGGPFPPIRIDLTIGATQRATENQVFSGSGHYPGSSDSLSLAGYGRELGLSRPILTQVQLHMLYGLRHFGFGVVMGGLWGNADHAPTRYAGLIGGSLNGFEVGPELRTMWSHDWFEVSASLAGGYETLGVPIIAFEKVSCGKGGRCYPTASADRFFLEPRVTFTFHAGAFAFGGYGGGDVLPGGGFSAGGFLGVAPEAWRKRGEIRSTTVQ
ncbi:MAG TPA: hypothetical protein VFF06_10915 [Polyangia bacterium]|nr:hypothetical protein [Polyangia bacterium]